MHIIGVDVMFVLFVAGKDSLFYLPIDRIFGVGLKLVDEVALGDGVVFVRIY